MQRVHRQTDWANPLITRTINTYFLAETQSEGLAEALELRMKQLSADAETLQSMDARSSSAPVDPNASFSSADDDDIAAALASRVDGGETEPADNQAPLTALELATLVTSKYGKKYDLTIARRPFAGRDFVSLNIMWVHLDQRSFPMTPEQYLDKLDSIAMLLNVWERQAYVRDFFRQKPMPKNGMPPRPIVGTAVALQLELPPDQIEEWLGARLG
eukprot:jgi/Ulvmu1/9975/UM059_0024.1